MNTDSDEIGERLSGIGFDFLRLHRARAKNRRNVGGSVFQDRIRRRHRSHIAPCARERYPGRWRVMPIGGQHIELRVCGRAGVRVKERVGPVRERNAEVAGPVRIEVAETVAHGHAMTVTIHASQRGEDIGSGVRNKRGVMVGQNRPLAFKKVQQVGHLLEIGRNVGVIADEMRVIELNIDNMLYLSLGRVQRTSILSL